MNISRYPVPHAMEIEVIRAHIKDMLEARGDDVTYIEEHGDAVDALSLIHI